MGEKSWRKAFKRSMNIIFTKDDFEKYLTDCKSNLPFYKKYLRENAKILDIGCGLGVGSIPLSTFGYIIVGIDNDLEVVKAATLNAKNFGRDVEIIHGDIFSLDKMFSKNSFDACISGGLLEHFSKSQIRTLIKKQLILAPLLMASMPIATYPGETWNDGIERNLWESKYWQKDILDDFNIVEYKESKASESIGGFSELSVVIRR